MFRILWEEFVKVIKTISITIIAIASFLAAFLLSMVLFANDYNFLGTIVLIALALAVVCVLGAIERKENEERDQQNWENWRYKIRERHRIRLEEENKYRRKGYRR